MLTRRRHPPPRHERVTDAVRKLKGVGLDFFAWDPDDAASLQRSLSLTNKTSPMLTEPVVDMCTAANQAALYFIAPEQDKTEWGHYALAIPYYTHFTSPIRRYADVMVHRALQAVLDGPEAVAALAKSGVVAGGMDTGAGDGAAVISAQCEQCNDRKAAAKKAQEDLDLVYLCVFLRSSKQPYETWATVVDVGGNSCKVVVDGLGLSMQCFYDRNGGQGTVEEEHRVVLVQPAEAPDSEEARGAAARLTEAERRWAGRAPHSIPFVLSREVRAAAADKSIFVPPPSEDASGAGGSAIAAALAAVAGKPVDDMDPVLAALGGDEGDEDDAAAATSGAGAAPALAPVTQPYPAEMRVRVLDRVRVRLVTREDRIPSGESTNMQQTDLFVVVALRASMLMDWRFFVLFAVGARQSQNPRPSL